MGGRAVKVEVVFLDVFAVVSLAVGQAEQAAPSGWVVAIPQGEAKAE